MARSKSGFATMDPEKQRRISAKGGQAQVPKGFAVSGKAAEAGRKSGFNRRKRADLIQLDSVRGNKKASNPQRPH